jgi:hypothetical protein
MKKILFVAILAGCFFIAKPILATAESGRLTTFQDVWDAINDLKNQIASIQSEQGALSSVPSDSQEVVPGVARYVYSMALTNNIDNADLVSEDSGEKAEGKSYFMKVDTPQISVSDMPMISLFGKEDSSNIRLEGDAWQSKDNYTYVKDGSIYILYAGKKDRQDPVYYLPKGAYKIVVVY